MIVITIGQIRNRNEMFGWASADNGGKAMAFGVESFNMFAHIAYYIHGGKNASSLSCQSEHFDGKPNVTNWLPT